MFKAILLGCGASKGTLFLGSLKCLIEKEIIDFNKIELFAGVSIGSVFAFLFIIGYSIADLSDFLENFDGENLNSLNDLEYLIENFGLNDGKKVLIMLETFLYSKYKIKDITFLELYQKFNKILLIQVCNLNKHSVEIFYHETQPNLSVLTAIRMSISIPFYFTPVIYDNYTYIDPGILISVPELNDEILNKFKLEKKECLILHLKHSLCIEPEFDNFFDYFISVMTTYYYGKDNLPFEFPYIDLESKCTTILPNKNNILEMINDGYEQTKNQYEKLQNYLIKD